MFLESRWKVQPRGAFPKPAIGEPNPGTEIPIPAFGRPKGSFAASSLTARGSPGQSPFFTAPYFQDRSATLPFRRINAAKIALFQRFLWRFDVIVVVLPQNLRRCTSYNVVLVYSLCIYSKEIIGQTSDGTNCRYRSFRRWYAVSKDCFMAG